MMLMRAMLMLMLMLVVAGWFVGCNCGSGQPPDAGTGGSGAGQQGGGAAGGASGGLAGGSTSGGNSAGGAAVDSCDWSLSLGNTSSIAGDLLALDDGSVIVSGLSLSVLDAGSGGFAARLSSTGTVLWVRPLGPTVSSTRLSRSTDGHLLVVGSARSVTDCANHHGALDVYFAKLDLATGAKLLQTCIGGDDDETATAVREFVDPVLGPVYQLTGDTDSHSSFDVGPKHGGGGFNAPDLLHAIVWEDDGGLRANVAGLGSNGPESGAGFLDDGTPFGGTFGDNSGDLLGQPEPQFSDLMRVSFDGGICTARSCTVSARRIGGNGNDAVARVLPGNVVAGETRSNDAGTNPAGFGCAGAAQSTPKAFLARVGGQGLEGLRCLAGSSAATVADLDAVDGGYWLSLSTSPADGDFAAPDRIVDAGPSTNDRGGLLKFDATLQQVERRIWLSGFRVAATAARPDGCLVVTTQSSGRIVVRALRP